MLPRYQSGREETNMHNNTLATLLVAATTIGLAGIAQAQTQTPAPTLAPAAAAPLFATPRVEGTDNVYVFRYQNHQAMFVVTPAGAVATDPRTHGPPPAAGLSVPQSTTTTE